MSSRWWRVLVFSLILAAAAGPLWVWGGGYLRAEAAPSPTPEPIADHVVAVGIAGLQWEDVNDRDTPTLAKLTREGSTATVSARSAMSVTCPAEGWLTVGSGTYAAFVDPSEIDAKAGCDERQAPHTDASGSVPAMPHIVDVNEKLRFNAHPGLLGESLPCTTAVGDGAALAAANPEGYVSHFEPSLPPDAEGLFRRCPFTAVDLGEVMGEGAARAEMARSIDTQLGRVVSALPPESILIVVGVSETDSAQPYLHVGVVTGPTFGPGWLRSPSTRRVPYSQLVDVAPTVLETLGYEVPTDIAGQALRGGGAGRPDSLAATIAELTDSNTQAVAQRSVLGPFFVILGVLLIGVVGTVAWMLHRRHKGQAIPRSLLRWLSIVALGLGAVPAASFVANIIPWWRSSWPVVTIWGVVLLCVMLMTSAALLFAASGFGVWHSDSWNYRIKVRISVLALLTVGVFVVDGVTGTWLQLNSMLGYNPLVAGRFVGFGNIAFAVFATAAIMLATFLAHGYRRWISLTALAGVAVPVIIFDGLPQWGADFGGVLSLVPTFVVLGLMLIRAPITWQRVGLATVAGFALVMAIGWLDYLRPEDTRSHFGRFVASVMDGSAVHTIERKLRANVDLLFTGPHTIAAMVGVILGIVLVLRPPAGLRRTFETWPVVRITLIAACVLAVFAFVTNDSGVAIPTVMALVLLPTIAALSVWAVEGDPWHPPPPPTDSRELLR